MDASARHTLEIVAWCVENGRVVVLPHFRQRLEERLLTWADVLVALDNPETMRSDGFDQHGHDRWILVGRNITGERIGVLLTIGEDSAGHKTIFITVFWGDA